MTLIIVTNNHYIIKRFCCLCIHLYIHQWSPALNDFTVIVHSPFMQPCLFSSYHLFMRYILHIISDYTPTFPYTFQLLLWTIQIFFIWFPLGQMLKVLIQKKQNQVEYNQLTPRRPAASHSHEKYSLLAPVWILVFLKTTHQSGRGRHREKQYRVGNFAESRGNGQLAALKVGAAPGGKQLWCLEGLVWPAAARRHSSSIPTSHISLSHPHHHCRSKA